MVCLRLPSIFLGLFLSLATLGKHSTATTHHAIETLLANGTHHAVVSNEIAQGARVEAERKWMKGRKMGMKGEALKCEKLHGSGKKEMNLECEVRVSSQGPPSNVELVGLMPFSSDYHAPKTHPPKNN